MQLPSPVPGSPTARSPGLSPGRSPGRKGTARGQSSPYAGEVMLCNEEDWSLYTDRGLLFPTAPLKFRFDLWIFALIVYSSVNVPFRLCMNHPATGMWWFVEVIISLFFIVDVVLTFNTAYMRWDDGLLVLDRRQISINYLRGWFALDALAATPIELIDLAIKSLSAHGHASAETESLRVLRILRLFRLVRLLRLLKLRTYVDKLEDTMNALNINLQILQFAKVVAGILYLMHILGCFWFALADASTHEVTWLMAYGDPAAVHVEAVWQHYLLSIYWALTTLTTVGYGDIVPQNDSERKYALCTFMTGALVFGFLLSSVADLVKNADPIKVRKDKRLDEVKHYLRWHRFTPELVARVKRYYEFYLAQQSAMDEEEIVDALAPALKRDVQSHLLSRSVRLIPLLHPLELDMQLQLHAALRPLMRESHETISEPGEKGSEGGEHIYFVRRGGLEAHGDLPDVVLFEINAYQRPGLCIGEHALMRRIGAVTADGKLERLAGEERRAIAKFTYKTKTRCDLYSLSISRLTEILSSCLGGGGSSGSSFGSGGGDGDGGDGGGLVLQMARSLWLEHLLRLEWRVLVLSMRLNFIGPWTRMLFRAEGFGRRARESANHAPESGAFDTVDAIALSELSESAALRLQARWMRRQVARLRAVDVRASGVLEALLPRLFTSAPPAGVATHPRKGSRNYRGSVSSHDFPALDTRNSSSLTSSAMLASKFDLLSARLDQLTAAISADREQQAENIRRAVREAVTEELATTRSQRL